MKTPDGYVAVPWQTDVRVWWYHKSLLEQAGAKVPTTWDELMTAGQALKKKGVSGFAHRSRLGEQLWAHHAMVAMMINNGGGMFDPGRQARLRHRREHPGDDSSSAAGQGGHHRQGRGHLHHRQPGVAVELKKAAIGIHTPGLDVNAVKCCRRPGGRGPLTCPSGD